MALEDATVPDYLDLPLERFLEQVAARKPAPGGGASAAVTVALAAALSSMSARLSADHLGEATALAKRAERLTADFSVIDPYRMMRTDDSAEKSTQPIVHVWCVRVNINATRCQR